MAVSDTPDVQVNIWMNPELRDEIDVVAKHLDVNRSQFVRRACRELLVRLSERLIVVSDDTIAEVTK
jgi:metal-responsive CopG/Arc/MetJ family transcriptional regulator